MSATLYRRKGSPNWWYGFTVPGRERVRRSSGTPVKAIARRLADNEEEKEWERRADGDAVALTFYEAAMIYKQAGKPADHLPRLIRHFKETRVGMIKPGDIQQAARILYPGLSPATWNRQAIVPARAVINHAAELGMCGHMKVRLFRHSSPVRRAVDGDWLSRFREHAPEHLGTLALFMACTGARIGQAIKITWDKMSLSDGEATIPPAKGYPERVAYLPAELVASLANIRSRVHRLRRHRGRELVFGLTSRSSVYRQWRAACAKAGIPYVPTHQAGRHTFFTEMIVRNGIDPKTAGDLGGCASPALLLKTYSHPEEPRKVINRVFGTFQAQAGQKSPEEIMPRTNRNKGLGAK
jgi:hypothetical protein